MNGTQTGGGWNFYLAGALVGVNHGVVAVGFWGRRLGVFAFIEKKNL